MDNNGEKMGKRSGRKDEWEKRGRKESKHERILREMREKLKEAYLPRDRIIIFGEGMLNDIDKTINILFNRLSEWYAIYFPELELEDRKKYCELVIVIDKNEMEETKKRINELIGEDDKKSEEIISNLEKSSGIDLEKSDIEELIDVAKYILDLIKLRKKVESYVDKVTKETCLNLSTVTGERVTAKLIAHIGGLNKLASIPASTIQVLGAEKALFKHLKKKTKPPKHGIIFQHTEIHSSPKEIRGKIARALAAKISIAARMDNYGKNFIGDELRKKFEERVKNIKEEFEKKEKQKEKK